MKTIVLEGRDREVVEGFLRSWQYYKAYCSVRPLPDPPEDDELPTGFTEKYWQSFEKSIDEKWFTADVYASVLNSFYRSKEQFILPRNQEEIWIIEDHAARMRPFAEVNERGINLRILSKTLHRVFDGTGQGGHVTAQLDIWIDSALKESLERVSINGSPQMSNWKMVEDVLYGGTIHGDRDRNKRVRELSIESYIPHIYHWLTALTQMIDDTHDTLLEALRAGEIDIEILNGNPQLGLDPGHEAAGCPTSS